LTTGIGTGSTTINAPVVQSINRGVTTYGAINTAAGTTLTLGNFTFAQYGTFQKTGTGTLNITGQFGTVRGGYGSAGYNIDVQAGTLDLSGGSSNFASGASTVDSGGTLTGASTLQVGSSVANSLTILSGGKLSPGDPNNNGPDLPHEWWARPEAGIMPAEEHHHGREAFFQGVPG
jgi:hypothetical protein